MGSIPTLLPIDPCSWSLVYVRQQDNRRQVDLCRRQGFALFCEVLYFCGLRPGVLNTCFVWGVCVPGFVLVDGVNLAPQHAVPLELICRVFRTPYLGKGICVHTCTCSMARMYQMDGSASTHFH